MYHLIGSEKIVETVFLLSKPYAPEGEIHDEKGLKESYGRFVSAAQPTVPHSSVRPIEYVDDFATVRSLMGIFNSEATLLDDFDPEVIDGSDTSQRWKIDSLQTLKRAQDNLRWAATRFPEFYDVFSLVINTVFAAKSRRAGGGSTSAAIGVIWSDSRPTWSRQDLFEFFVHEFTHNSMFLDELRYQHYFELAQVVKPENFAQSAILTRKRPLDKVLHSLVVATEVLLARDRYLGHPGTPKAHPPSTTMLPRALETIDSLREMPNSMELLTDRSRDLIELCHEQLLLLEPRIAYSSGHAAA